MTLSLARLLDEYRPAYGETWDGAWAALSDDRGQRELVLCLVEDIARRGIRSPIALSGPDDLDEVTPHPQVLNGMHRIAAARELGIERVPVRFGLPSGDDEFEYRLSLRVSGASVDRVLESLHPTLSFRFDGAWVETGGSMGFDGDRFHAVVSSPRPLDARRLEEALRRRLSSMRVEDLSVEPLEG